ncbi:hypothetical protein [Haladaptatus sp. DYF46]|uniref:hypothetical protein n=1 Tax=Haladaptatus sp. DYF46 TaxID=2886041 RepID=UPI001E331BFF|nr:hypothetical protein [Haladaptatus sp. DYF46]
METHEMRGVGSVVIGTMMVASSLLSASTITPYAALGSIGGAALVAIGIMQYRDSRHFSADEPASTSQTIAVFALAAVSFAAGMASYWFL